MDPALFVQRLQRQGQFWLSRYGSKQFHKPNLGSSPAPVVPCEPGIKRTGEPQDSWHWSEALTTGMRGAKWDDHRPSAGWSGLCQRQAVKCSREVVSSWQLCLKGVGAITQVGECGVPCRGTRSRCRGHRCAGREWPSRPASPALRTRIRGQCQVDIRSEQNIRLKHAFAGCGAPKDSVGLRLPASWDSQQDEWVNSW